jgi:hypothetical protein
VKWLHFGFLPDGRKCIRVKKDQFVEVRNSVVLQQESCVAGCWKWHSCCPDVSELDVRRKCIFRWTSNPMQERPNRLCSTPSLFHGCRRICPGCEGSHHHLEPRLRMRGAVIPLAINGFMACTKITLPSTFTNNSMQQ